MDTDAETISKYLRQDVKFAANDLLEHEAIASALIPADGGNDIYVAIGTLADIRRLVGLEGEEVHD